MKITVDRITDKENRLVFTITVSEPTKVPMSEEEIKALWIIQKSIEDFAKTLSPDSVVYQKLISANENIKQTIFQRVLDKLRFSIDNDLDIKINPMCQEIYNWIYDHQDGYIKQWMSEIDPQRSKYYFDNDKTIESDYTED